MIVNKLMSLQVAIQMDPVAGIDIRGDTTFTLALKRNVRGMICLSITPLVYPWI